MTVQQGANINSISILDTLKQTTLQQFQQDLQAKLDFNLYLILYHSFAQIFGAKFGPQARLKRDSEQHIKKS